MAHVWLQELAHVGLDGLDPAAVLVRNSFFVKKALIKNSIVIERESQPIFFG
jgi:hypothetical protein